MDQDKFSSHNFYKFSESLNLINTQVHNKNKGIKLLWKCSIIKKHRIFFKRKKVIDLHCLK